MKKIKKLFLLSVFGITSVISYSQGYIVHDLRTGIVNGTNTPIAYGSHDDTWKFAFPGSSTFSTPLVCTNLGGAWDVNSCGRWLTNKYNLGTYDPHAGAPAGNYKYQTTFNMSHSCFPWAKINLSYAGGDNMLTGLLVNGNVYSITPGSSNDFSPLAQNITINLNTSHILLGTNTITLILTNNESYQGIFICGDVSVGHCP